MGISRAESMMIVIFLLLVAVVFVHVLHLNFFDDHVAVTMIAGINVAVLMVPVVVVIAAGDDDRSAIDNVNVPVVVVMVVVVISVVPVSVSASFVGDSVHITGSQQQREGEDGW